MKKEQSKQQPAAAQTEQPSKLTPEQLKAIKKAKEKVINSGKIVTK